VLPNLLILAEHMGMPLNIAVAFVRMPWDLRGLAWDLSVQGLYPALPWMGYVFLGLFMSRLDLGAVRVQRRLLVGGIVVAAAMHTVSWAGLAAADYEPQINARVTNSVESSEVKVALMTSAQQALLASMNEHGIRPRLALITSGRVIVHPDEVDIEADPDYLAALAFEHPDLAATAAYAYLPRMTWASAFDNYGHSHRTPAMVSAAAVAVSLIGACLVGMQMAPRMLALLAAAGAMSLTIYLLHAFLLLFEVSFGFYESILALLGYFALCCWFAGRWFIKHRRGPLETPMARVAGRRT